MKKLMLSVFIFLCFPLMIHAQNDAYQVIDLADDSVIASFSVFQDAENLMNQNSNAGVMYQNELIAMNEGVVVLRHDSCSVNIDTVYEMTNQNGYVNGCYGNDGLYLKTSSSGEWYLMLMSGARMWVHRDDAELVPYREDLKLSSYFIKDDHLYHQIRTRWESDDYGSVVDLGHTDLTLKEGIEYYSYDGHSFYTDFFSMSSNMKMNTDVNAVNAGNPYYNYFMFLPHRSISAYNASDFRAYFDSLGINKALNQVEDQNQDSINDVLNRSQLVDALDSFVYAQAEYGSNALLMLSLSMNESASGRSSLAYRRNNLFGHSAFDSDVEGNAKRYLNVENSVISHAKNYISLSYANPDRFTYHGSFFGDKNSGMSVSYASDPYWSEKAASYAYELDEAMGQKDLNRYALAIVKDELRLKIYDESFNTISVIEKIPLMSFVILDETEDAFLVQLDQNEYLLDGKTGTYDFSKNIGYIKKEDVDVIVHSKNECSNSLEKIVFDANGGVFKDGTDQKILQFTKGSEPVCEQPVLQNAVFDYWNQVSAVQYEAVYRTAVSISMHALPDQVTELNVPLSLAGGSIQVEYEDGSSEIVELTTSMISGYVLSEAGDQEVIVAYGGVSTSYPLRVSLNMDEQRNTMNEWIEMISLKEIDETEKITLSLKLKELMQSAFYPVFSMNTITKIDELLKANMEDELSVILEKNDYHLSVSGVFLTEQIKDSSFPLIKPTIKISVESHHNDSKLYSSIEALGWKIEDSFEIDYQVNDTSETWSGPMLFSIDRPDQKLKKWAVIYLDEEDAVECHTSVSQNRIRFKAFHPGSYVLVSKESVNAYESEDIADTMTFSDNGLDYPLILKAVYFGAVMLLSGLIAAVVLLKKCLK